MDAASTATPFTYDDYKRISASTDERFELIDGRLCTAPAPTVAHQTVAKNLLFLLEAHARATGCGQVLHAPVDVVLFDGERRNVVQPDLLFVARERSGIVGKTEIAGAPHLVIEVLSPATAERDRGSKLALYARCRVREYWIADPAAERIEVHTPRRGMPGPPAFYVADDFVPAVAVPDFRLPVTKAFNAP